MGLFLITTRNGNQKQPEKYPKPYAEKLMIVEENQVTPMHFHWFKTEDIINRGGGNLMIKLYKADENEWLSDEDVEIVMDGEVSMCNDDANDNRFYDEIGRMIYHCFRNG
ncbi:MAG: D-lyxose/D-mannose family sugar isomerase [Ruminococcaceae bacterium]|nr:D-lyxose/D-mannose family sugar isomerase [Oscillospiraceae bacterium]